ncbi:unnamed protein product [Onchocerca flexuosa]|uniref:Uncharacterized protein n=1 Tax=Onchocerca flexuosa TaxID=387005 RepID=A0A183I3W8_9BILA|nr:unnamed protein product [Onchocerca flexuosa]
MQSTLVSCPLEMHKIPVPRCDAVFDAQCIGKTEIPFVRAKYDKNTGHGFNVPREQFKNVRIVQRYYFIFRSIEITVPISPITDDMLAEKTKYS